MFHPLPKQMRYQAAPLPDGGFPRGSAFCPQPAFGTKRNRTAQRGTLIATFCATHKTAPASAVTGSERLTTRGVISNG